MEEKIQSLLKEVSEFTVKTKSDVETFRLRFISRKGALGELFEDLKQIPAEQKKQVGKVLNELKQKAESKFAEFNQAMEAFTESTTDLDLSLPPVPNKVGNLHPLTLTRLRIIEIFERGWTRD
jgi:phenylalanyl-tRNA synthetase alpha chain